MKQIKALLQDRAFCGLLALAVLAAGLAGYILLRKPAAQQPQPSAPTAEVSAPVQQMPSVPTPEADQIIVPIAEPEPVPEPAPVIPVPEYVPDDVPVIAAPPRVSVSPLEGDIVTAFSVEELLYNETLADWRTHDGVDIAAEAGESVLAAAAGTVYAVENDPLMGTMVIIDHADGCRTTYANLQPELCIEIGDSVSAGQVIGSVGQTAAAEAAQGPHLHFSASRDGIPIDPAEYLD